MNSDWDYLSESLNIMDNIIYISDQTDLFFTFVSFDNKNKSFVLCDNVFLVACSLLWKGF